MTKTDLVAHLVSANAAIRPWQCETPPRSTGVPTGTLAKGGYADLTPEVKTVIDEAIAIIRQDVDRFRFKRVFFSSCEKGSTQVVDLSRVVCASPSYLARHGRPVEPSDLVRHACLTLSRNPGSASWPFRINGKRARIDVKGPVSADSADMLLKLAIGGAGILRLSEHVVASSIHEGLLQPLLQDAQDPETYPLYALLPPGRLQAPKVRVFIDFLIERLGAAPWRTGR
jgi:hypothetical protein